MKKSIVRIIQLLMSLVLVVVVSSVVVSSIMPLPSVNGTPTTNNMGSFVADILYIQTGEKYNGYEELNTDWKLHIGSGERTYTTALRFDSPFREPPKVSLALTGQDVDATKNNRIQVKARDITVDGFNIVYITWTDSIVYSIWTTWTAIGLKP
jgi:hypothetical protein